MYGADPDAIVIREIFNKKTSLTPKRVIGNCQRRLQRYDREANR
jgi:phage-related protein